MSDNAQDVANPAGALSHRMAPDAPISGVYAGALIGKIGVYLADRHRQPGARLPRPSAACSTSASTTITCADNRGEFVVNIGVQRR